MSTNFFEVSFSVELFDVSRKLLCFSASAIFRSNDGEGSPVDGVFNELVEEEVDGRSKVVASVIFEILFVDMPSGSMICCVGGGGAGVEGGPASLVGLVSERR